MDVAAGIVGFVGLTGQMLQGCNYLCNFFADARDAPETISTISNDLDVVHSTLVILQKTFSDLLTSHQCVHLNLQDPNCALKNCQAAIDGLRKFVDEFNKPLTPTPSDLQTPSGAVTQASSFATLRGAWRKLHVARKDDKLRQYALRLEQAKTSLQLVQSNIAMSLHHDLRSRTISIQTSLSQTANNAEDTRDMMELFRNELRSEFCCMHTVLSSLTETAVAKAMAQNDTYEASEMSTDLRHPHHTDEAQSEHTHAERAWVPSNHSSAIFSRAPFSEASENERNENGVFSTTMVKRGPRKSRTNVTIHYTWFGHIRVATTVTQLGDPSLSEDSSSKPLSAKAVAVTVLPKPWFLKMGILLQCGNNVPSFSHPSWDMRLRVIRVHQEDSEVHKALTSADYLAFRQLLGTGEVTPYDVVLYKRDRQDSLFKVAISALGDWVRKDYGEQKGLDWVEMARIFEGCDRDEASEGNLALISRVRAKAGCYRVVIQTFVQMIIKFSVSNPLESASAYYAGVVDQIGMVRSAMVSQDIWDLFEFKQEFQAKWGVGAYQYLMVNGRFLEDWRDAQKKEWRQTPASSRMSQGDCLERFGSDFVRFYWPLLCWAEERPLFWRDRDACEEAYGDCFADYKWPHLFWQEERPSFWQSRDSCMDFFGQSFVEGYWPYLSGQQCFEHLEGKGAWKATRRNGYGIYWSNYRRNYWISEMINAWWQDDEALRRTRAHCLQRYGANFVKEQWHELLREEWGPEDEIMDLTADGADLEWKPVGEIEDMDEDEDSDGWETVEED